MATPLTEANLNDPVTMHMGHDLAKLRLGQTVGESLQAIRKDPPAGRIIYFYVVDADDRVRGVVPTRRLLLSPTDRPISEIMVERVIALPADATVLDACEFFTLHRLLAFPVVDSEGRLLGAIDVELYADELKEIGSSGANNDDLFQLVGVHAANARQTTPLAAFRNRFPWLLCNIAAGILCALISGIFEAELNSVIALALFIPVVLNLSESVSIQSVSLALQLLRGKPPSLADVVRKLRWELLTGVLLGLGCAILVGLVAWIWIGKFRVVLCLLGGIAGGITMAAAAGIAIPNLLYMMRRNPQVAAGPIVLALADISTLLVYLNLSRWLLS